MDAYDNGEIIMRILELLEGGNASIKTQSTVLTPKVVLKAEKIFNKFIKSFNEFLKNKQIPPIRKGRKLGSSAYAEKDIKVNPDKEYGDIDAQLIAPDNENIGHSQFAGYWNSLVDEFIKSGAVPYVDIKSQPGKPLFNIGPPSPAPAAPVSAFAAPDAPEPPPQVVQIDLIWHAKKLANWGAARATPEHNIKGLLTGNMWSTTGELLDLSIQHAGLQAKIMDKKRVPFSKKAGVQLVTIAIDPETWIYDVFKNEVQDMGINIEDAIVDPLLMQNTGVNADNVKIEILANGIIGMAKSFESNNMFGKGSLAKFTSAEDFLNKWWDHYQQKAIDSMNSKKYDKAVTPQAIARVKADKENIIKGLEIVKGYFK